MKCGEMLLQNTGVKWYTDNSYYQCEGVCFRAEGKTFFYRAVRV